jgi:hypothetical protein
MVSFYEDKIPSNTIDKNFRLITSDMEAKNESKATEILSMAR